MLIHGLGISIGRVEAVNAIGVHRARIWIARHGLFADLPTGDGPRTFGLPEVLGFETLRLLVEDLTLDVNVAVGAANDRAAWRALLDGDARVLLGDNADGVLARVPADHPGAIISLPVADIVSYVWPSFRRQLIEIGAREGDPSFHIAACDEAEDLLPPLARARAEAASLYPALA